MLAKTRLPATAKLTPIFSQISKRDISGIVHPDFEAIYQDNLWFEQRHPEKPVIYASFVTSIDGKIAFPDQPQGPLVARENHIDAIGAALDWWMLNALRTSSDGLIFGVKTLQQEPELTGHIYDEMLQQIRLEQERQAIPWNIIITHDSGHIPFDHRTFTHQEIPVVIVTLASQLQTCLTALQAVGRKVSVLNEGEQIALIPTTTYILPYLDKGIEANLVQLKTCGLDKILVESPTLTHYLIEQQLLDELFMTQSGLYVGGNAQGIGQKQAAFTSNKHPHTQLMSVHHHEQAFLYFRYQLVYGK